MAGDKIRINKGRRADLLLLGFFLLVGAILAAVVFTRGTTGGAVEVRVGNTAKILSLSVNDTYVIDGAIGGTNTLVIEDGAAYLADADCPDQLCVHMGKITKKGQSIICLPHQVVIEVIRGGEENEADAVAGG